MTTLGILCAILSALALVALEIYCCRQHYHAGRKRGFKEGCIATDQWWNGVEEEVDRARQQIWREEAKKGKELES